MVQPTATQTGAVITPAVQVAALDSAGNTDPTFTGAVTLGIAPATGRPGAVLSGTKTVNAVLGVATFSNLSIDSAAANYRLTATAPGAGGATSATFAITSGTATHLVFTVEPSTTLSGHNIAPNVRVAAQDVLGNTDPTFVGNVTVAIGTNATRHSIALASSPVFQYP